MNKVVKKIAAVALSGLLVASVFAGCSGGSAKDTYTVGICQSMQHPALDKATEGFKKALTDKLGDKVTFKEQNAAGDSTLCSTIVNQYVSQNVDLIMANATPALQAAQAATNTIPVLGTSVTEYGVAQLKGKTLKERARALIKICHPKFRPKLALEYRHRFKEDPFPREEIGDYIKEVREEVYKTAVSIIGG